MDGQPLQNPEAYGNAWFVNEVKYVDTPDREMEALSVISPDSIAVADVKFQNILGTSRPVAPGDTIYETTYSDCRWKGDTDRSCELSVASYRHTRR